jgi:hypothetical protein
MIARILRGSPMFAGVAYNTHKIDRDKGELMLTANFGPLQALTDLRPQDYVNYLIMVSGLNKGISDPQFHATISAKGRTYDKHTLTKIAVLWLNEMGYGEQPYLVVFHKDTGNNHVHVVSTRVDRNGVKIPSDFEKRRSVRAINKVLGYDHGFRYKFSTRAQFLMILESKGFPGVDPDERLVQERISKFRLDKGRAAEIREILRELKNDRQFITVLKERYNIDLQFHSAEGKKPYGYTVIDHTEKKVFKGSEVYPLKELLNLNEDIATPVKEKLITDENTASPAYIQSIWIADDVDDQQIHGMRRRRQKKARTNTR